MQFEEKTIERKEIYQGPIFQVVTDQVELPAGKGQAQRDLIFHNGAVAVLPITEDGKTILVKQYRKAIERTSVEIPAGKLEKGENADPQAAALRELEEEIGYTADLELLYDFYSAKSSVVCPNNFRLFRIDHFRTADVLTSPCSFNHFIG